MKVWVPQSSRTYALVGKFPHIYINQLITERKIEAADVSVGSYKVGYRVISPFFVECEGVVLNVNDDFIITGE